MTRKTADFRVLSKMGVAFGLAMLASCATQQRGVSSAEILIGNSIAAPDGRKALEPPSGDPIPAEMIVSDDLVPLSKGRQMVSAGYIIRTGEIPAYGNDEIEQKLNLRPTSLFAFVMHGLYGACVKEVEKDSVLKNLMEKPEWGVGDREAWEEQLSHIVSSTVAQMPGMQSYRTEQTGREQGVEVRRVNNLNELMKDVLCGGSSIEFDCEGMSAAEVVLLQSLDKRFLSGEGHETKRPQNYYITHGMVSFERGPTGPHAFIISGATGNIIEATELSLPGSAQSPYLRTPKNYGVMDYANGTPCIVQRHDRASSYAVYGADMLPEQGAILIYGKRMESVNRVLELGIDS